MDDVVQATGVTLTQTQIKGIKRQFNAMDTNRDGKISEDELKQACKKLGILLTRDEVQEIMREADNKAAKKDKKAVKNGATLIEYATFEKLIGHQLVIANFKTKQMKDAFRKFDKDDDGYITAVEIRDVFLESGVELTDEDLAELIAEADENGDGVISFEVENASAASQHKLAEQESQNSDLRKHLLAKQHEMGELKSAMVKERRDVF